MPVEKMSVSIPAETAALVRAAAAARGVTVSGWVASALRERAQGQARLEEARADAQALVREAEAVHGPATEDELAWVRRTLLSAGVDVDQHRLAG